MKKLNAKQRAKLDKLRNAVAEEEPKLVVAVRGPTPRDLPELLSLSRR